MQTKCTIQYNGQEMSIRDYEKQALNDLKMQGVKRKNIETLDLYFNANEGVMYYVATTTDKETSGKLV